MQKSILLIRHAESANNALPESERVPDPGLTQLGHEQARRLADGLTQFPISHLYCSPFRRSLETTQPVSLLLKLTPAIHAEIYEQGGCYSGFEPGHLRGEPGMSRAQLEKGYPGWSIDESIGTRGWNEDRDYETHQQAIQRAGRVTQWLTRQWSPTSSECMAALIIHADFKRVLISALLESDGWPDRGQPIWNTAISHLKLVGSQWKLQTWNMAEHLTHQLRTPPQAGASAA